MPRLRRIIRPGEIIHVISRFVDDEFRLTCPEERAEYLRRLGKTHEESDWRLLSYAMMSTHVHLAEVAGHEPFGVFIQRVHSPFSSWLNRRQGRRGPVFRERPKTLAIHPVWAPRLIAYHHNNPPRAGVVEHALESDWTSHRGYVGAAPRPAYLSVDLGLKLMGLEDDVAGRAAFDEYVNERRDQPRDPALSGDVRQEKAQLTDALGAAVGLAHPRSGPAGIDYLPRVCAERWAGDLRTIMRLVGRHAGIAPKTLAARTRRPEVVHARRLCCLVATGLGFTNQEVGLHLGVTESAVRQLCSNATPEALDEARRLLASLGDAAA